jgi:uncharacterized protein
MDRVEAVRQKIDEILIQQSDTADHQPGLVHLYGVSAACTLLALRRGLDPELASLMGLLHDLYAYQFGKAGDHAERGALEAGQLLWAVGGFSAEEIGTVRQAIAHHSDKAGAHGPYEELLKDADILQHYLHDLAVPLTPAKEERLNRTLQQLGFPDPAGVPHRRRDPKLVVLQFNDCINRQDLAGLGSLMTADHVFIDSSEEVYSGKELVLEGWADFFRRYSDYRNHFSLIQSGENQVAVMGFSTCSHRPLAGPALWAARVENDLVSGWRVYPDRPENRQKLGLPS